MKSMSKNNLRDESMEMMMRKNTMIWTHIGKLMRKLEIWIDKPTIWQKLLMMMTV